MQGIHFVTNEKGKKVAVMIDLDRHGELWEDIHDHLIADSRAHEKSVPFAVVERRLLRRNAPPVADYRIVIKPSAVKEIDALAVSVAVRVTARINSLATTPRPAG